MEIGVFFRSPNLDIQKVASLFWIFKNSKYHLKQLNDFQWEYAYYKLIDVHNIRLVPDFECDINFLWDCCDVIEIQQLIKRNPDKKFFELCPLNLDHHIPKKADADYPNLFYLTSEITNEENCIFDLSLLLNRYVYHKDWNYHYLLRETFGMINTKPYRMDYSIYLPFKPNRIKYAKLFYKRYKTLFYSVNNFHTEMIKNNIEYNKYNQSLLEQYQNMESMYKDDLGFFVNMDKEFIIDDFFDGNGDLDYKINFKKFINTTIKSDISILMETDNGTEGDMQKNLVTEKTYDMLAVGKPFIAMCAVTDQFMEKFGFINYKKLEIFNKFTDELRIIHHILTCKENEYELIKKELYEIAKQNMEIFDRYVNNNTFITNLIDENK